MKIILSLFLLSILFNGCIFSKKRHNKTTNQIITKNIDINQQALIIGVNNYKGTNRDLVGTDIDIKNMDKLFSSWGFDVKVLKDTKSMDFEKELVKYAQTLNKDDVFILYFSGHGSSTVDRSGDELNDDRDELIVVSDGDKNLFLLDDNIDKYLDKIVARKLIIIDSCYSGTVNRSKTINQDEKIKYISAPPEVGDSYYQKKLLPQSFLTSHISGPSIFFGACRDDEKSISTSKGSKFTNELLTNISINKTPSLIHKETLKKLSRRFHPTLDSSLEELKDITLKSYLKIKVN